MGSANCSNLYLAMGNIQQFGSSSSLTIISYTFMLRNLLRLGTFLGQDNIICVVVRSPKQLPGLGKHVKLLVVYRRGV